MSAPYAHLARLTTATGLYEHALLTVPRIEHGMCVDDVARALVVTARQSDPSPQVVAMSTTYLEFLLDAQQDDGRMHNRRAPAGVWLDEASTEDQWGRALWAFGVAATHSPDPQVRAGAARGAARAMRARSTYPRSMAYAALGAAQLVGRDPDDALARRLLFDARQVLPAAGYGTAWPWPEERLSYANAVLPEAMIAIGMALLDDALRHDGLVLLAWLDDEQTVDGHLSVVPAGGRGRDDRRPGFDQQPIEVAALAEAARTALLATRDSRWASLLTRCEAWFVGANDSGLPMRDAVTGGGFDGLEDGSVNENQGAESTLAWLATRELALTAGAAVTA
ncbi:MAG: glycosyltransferase [Cellulomonas sp.]|nr:glycosyltransferase [Cellulomonas sp.]